MPTVFWYTTYSLWKRLHSCSASDTQSGAVWRTELKRFKIRRENQIIDGSVHDILILEKWPFNNLALLLENSNFNWEKKLLFVNIRGVITIVYIYNWVNSGVFSFSLIIFALNNKSALCARFCAGCRTGEAKLTKGFNLAARFIIHTVGPKYKAKYRTAAESSLFSCYRNILQLAM